MTRQQQPLDQVTISNEKVTLNPTGFSPLAATIAVTTSVATKISLRVVGKNGTGSDVSKNSDTLICLHIIPVLGLYAD